MPSDAAARLAAEEEIAGDVDRVAERQVLIDHLDPRRARVGRRGEERPALPSISIVPASGITAPDRTLLKRRLAGAIVADQPEHLARLQRQGHVVERLDGVVAL